MEKPFDLKMDAIGVPTIIMPVNYTGRLITPDGTIYTFKDGIMQEAMFENSPNRISFFDANKAAFDFEPDAPNHKASMLGYGKPGFMKMRKQSNCITMVDF